MLSFTIRRLLTALPVIFLVIVIIFSIVRLIPGDPAVALLGPGATDQQIEALRSQLNLDQPTHIQFFEYVRGLLQGDLGYSMRTKKPIVEELISRIPATIELSVVATLMAILIGIPAGILSSVRKNSIYDHITRVLSLVGVSIPAFWFAMLLQIVFSIYLSLLPVSGRLSPMIRPEPITGFFILDGILKGDLETTKDAILHLILPATVLAAFLGATIARFLRASMLEVLSQDYIRTARAKGNKFSRVLSVHAIRNSLLPVITITGLKFAELLGGAILTETVFAWPGMGRYMFEAIKSRDYPVIQGGTLLFAIIFLLSSLLVDLVYGFLDPRIRVEK